MVKHRLTFAAAFIACVMAHAAMAQPAIEAPTATTRPSRSGLDRRGDGQMLRPWRERLGSYDPTSGGGSLSEAEMVELRRFMETYSPNRLKRLEEVPEDRKEPIWRRIRGQYQALQRMKDEDQQVYDLRLKRLPIEDQMFALGWKLNRDDANERTSVTDLRSSLREQVRLFVENSLEERRIRLERAMARLKQEQQTYQRLLSEKEARIERGVSDIESERGDALRDLVGPLRPPSDRSDGRAEPSTATDSAAK